MKKLLIILALLVPYFSFCQIPEPLPNTYVNDLAGVLKPDELKSLNETILAVEKISSVQIAIVLINDLPDRYEIEDYAREIGRKWHVGNAKNGLVYVAAINAHKQRLEVASELEGDIPDIVAKQITDNLKPNFKNKDYYGGLQVLLNGINERIDPVIKEQNRLAELEQAKKNQKLFDGFISVLVWIGGIGVAAAVVWYFIFYPIQRRKRKAREEAEEKERELQRLKEKERRASYASTMNSFKSSHSAPPPPKPIAREEKTTYIPPIIPLSTDSDNYRSSSSSSSNSSDNSSSYGNWASCSSDSSSSSDSGYSGGGSSNDW